MSYEVTVTTDPTGYVSLTLFNLPTYVDTDDDSRMTFLIPVSDAESIGEALARIPGGTLRALTDELENLRLTTAEDKRHMDRQAGQIEYLKPALDDALTLIQRLSDERDRWKEVAEERQQNARELAAIGGDTSALRATTVRQANEITTLKENAA